MNAITIESSVTRRRFTQIVSELTGYKPTTIYVLTKIERNRNNLGQFQSGNRYIFQAKRATATAQKES